MKLKADTEDENIAVFPLPQELRQLVRKVFRLHPLSDPHGGGDFQTSRKDSPDADKPEYETCTEIQTLNSMVPIWQRNKKDVKDEEYNQLLQGKVL
jgi:molecular chaperone HtpG